MSKQRKCKQSDQPETRKLGITADDYAKAETRAAKKIRREMAADRRAQERYFATAPETRSAL